MSPHDDRHARPVRTPRPRRSTRRFALALAGVLALATAGCETRADPPTGLMLLNGGDATTGLVVSPSTLELRVGQFAQLSVAGPAELLPAVFSSDDASVASVGPTGIVTGVGVGTTIITVASSANPNRRTRAIVRVSSN